MNGGNGRALQSLLYHVFINVLQPTFKKVEGKNVNNYIFLVKTEQKNKFLNLICFQKHFSESA